MHPAVVKPFIPSKLVWTEADFEQMSWHDCRLHGLGMIDDFNPHQHELRLDIDYIFQWCDFGEATEPSGFWISPATLVFEPRDFHASLTGLAGNWIQTIERKATEAEGLSEWTIRFNTGGMITVQAAGFRQYIRRPPLFVPTPNQCLETSQRGVICFDKGV